MPETTTPITDAVRSSLDAAKTAPTDAGGAALALLYAQQIDDNPLRAEDLGPKLLTCLSAMGLTPAGRSEKSKGGATSGKPADALAALRAARGARSRRSPGVHPASA